MTEHPAAGGGATACEVADPAVVDELLPGRSPLKTGEGAGHYLHGQLPGRVVPRPLAFPQPDAAYA